MAPTPPDAGQRVVDAAAELFAERGYAGTTTRAIAERAGVNEVTVFRRFSTKAGILRALAERFAQGAAGPAVGSMPDPEDTQATLVALARLEIASAVHNGGLALRLAIDARSVPEVAEVLGQGSASNAERLAGYLAGRQRAGDLRADLPAELLAETFFGLTSSLVMGRLLLGGAAPPSTGEQQRLASQLVSLYWAGAAHPGRSDIPTTTSEGSDREHRS